MRHPKRAIPRALRTRHPKRRQLAEEVREAVPWPEGLTVREVMTPAPATVRPETTVAAAWRLMQRRRIRHLPVLDPRGRLIGIVSERDLRERLLDEATQAELAGSAGAGPPVEAVMTWGAVTVRPDTALREAARVMHQRRLGALPVVERDRLVGILTATDLLRVLDTLLRQGLVTRPERWGHEA